MSDKQRLREQLSEMGTLSPSQSERHLRGDSAQDLIQHFLCEIHETILPRKITLKNNEGILQTEVASRRILQITQAQLPERINEDNGLIDQTVNENDAAWNANLLAFLQTFFAGSKTVEMTSERSQAQKDPSQVGCSAQSLAKTWGLELYPETPEIPSELLEEYALACSKFATACVLFDASTQVASTGDTSLIELILQLTPDQVAEFDAKIIRAPDERRTLGCVLLNQNSQAGVTLLFARDDDRRAFVWLPAEQVSDALNAWKNLFI